MKPVSQLGQSHSLIATMWSVAAGYVTADDNYTWICQPCLEDLNAKFQWNVVSAPTDP